MTTEDLRRSAATRLPEALRLADGLQVARVSGRTLAVSARGFNISTSNKMLTMMDGRSLWTPLFSGVFWDEHGRAMGDASSTREHGGLGLGLAIVRKVVELHGGTVTAPSKGEGRGTTMTVTLPRRTAAPAPAVAPAPVPAGPIAGLRVLVVEDDADSRDLVEAVLSAEGARVTAVGSARDALACIERETPDLVVSDNAMQEHDGYALIGWIRALPGRAGAVPAVALTAYAGETDRRRVMAAGFQGFVAKPFDPGALVAVLARAASASRA